MSIETLSLGSRINATGGPDSGTLREQALRLGLRPYEDFKMPRRPFIDEITQAVVICTQLGRKEIESPQRTRHLVRARQKIWFLAVHDTVQSLPAIGRKFKRDHTTVMHGVETMISFLSGKNPRVSREEMLQELETIRDTYTTALIKASHAVPGYTAAEGLGEFLRSIGDVQKQELPQELEPLTQSALLP